jgi:retron-type reverse transcriptase
MPKPTDRYRLVLHELPVVESLHDLTTHTHLSPGLLYRLSRFPEKNYKTYELKKKSGGSRVISQPSREMKALQGWVLRSILDKLKASPASKGFETGTSTVDNARPHAECTALLALDIDDFFTSIKASWVHTIFRLAGYTSATASLLTDICTLRGSLPQGAPTSPKLANLACWKMDRRLMGFAGRRGIMYTRYADDMTFSSFSYRQLVRSKWVIEAIIGSEAFTINRKKTRLLGPSRCRSVTGLVLHDGEVGIGRRKYRHLRARIHKVCSEKKSKASDEEILSLNGLLAYVYGVDPTRAWMLHTYVNSLRRKYPRSAVSSLTTAEPSHRPDSIVD